MKKLLLIFVYLSHFILGHADIIIGGGGEVARPFGVFSELIETVRKYKKLQEVFNDIQQSPSDTAIQESLDNLISELIKFYDFHQKSFPIDYTQDIKRPFDTFNEIILLRVKNFILELDSLNKSRYRSPRDNYQFISLTTRNIDSINDTFIDTLLDILFLKPVHALKHTFQPNDLPPTHLYALILFYRENDESINSGVTTPITDIIDIFNSLRQSLLSETSTQSLKLFQSFLEEKEYYSGDTFEDYAQTHKLNDVDYNEQLLEAFAPAKRI